MPDYIPSNDSEFNLWQQGLMDYATTPANKTRMNIPDAQILPVTTEQTVWDAKYPAHTQAQTAANAAATAKDDSRTDYVGALRTFVGQLQANPDVTDEDRRAMKLTIASTSHTPSPVPATTPIAEIDIATRRRHIIEFRDSATPDKSAKPAGVRGCQIWMKIGGAAPTSESECQFLATDSKSPYVHDFTMEEIGLKVYYLLRWENTTGKLGPWSQIFSANVPG